MLDYNNDDFEDMFDLSFVIVRKRFDENITIELVPNGAQKRLTNQNKKEYIQAYVDYVFNKSVEQAFDAFSRGFHHVCGSKVLVSRVISH
jgi:E3 ubiquitin-protein ligase HERC4